MHSVGDGLHVCPVRGCESGLLDQGFSRYWTLVDHMKRIHNCSPTAHKVGGCTASCNGGSFKIAVKEKFFAATVEAEIPALQSEFDSLPPRTQLSQEYL
jgi:hypothetical protein